MQAEDLRAEGERALAASLLAEPAVRRVLDRPFPEARERRRLLGTATRLSPEMAPDLHAVVDHGTRTLGLGAPLEIYVYPEPRFNAAAVRPEQGRLLLLFSSGLLEAFAPEELRFVAGHELGHYLLDHHRVPLGALLEPGALPDPVLVLRVFAWQRYAEISADRAGLVAAGGLEASARALFKLASGLSGDRVRVDVEQFLTQAGELLTETERREARAEGVRQDWLATHPFSPLRLKAADLFSRSEAVVRGGTSRAEVEVAIQDLMSVMEPSYLEEPSDDAEAMRRLLFAGGVAVAAASGAVSDESIEALERLLGAGSIPPTLRPDVIRADLPARIEAVLRTVPPLRRAQVVRDLCLIARADRRIDPAEVAVVRDIASAVGVEPDLVTCLMEAPPPGCATSPPAA